MGELLPRGQGPIGPRKAGQEVVPKVKLVGVALRGTGRGVVSEEPGGGVALALPLLRPPQGLAGAKLGLGCLTSTSQSPLGPPPSPQPEKLVLTVKVLRQRPGTGGDVSGQDAAKLCQRQMPRAQASPLAPALQPQYLHLFLVSQDHVSHAHVHGTPLPWLLRPRRITRGKGKERMFTRHPLQAWSSAQPFHTTSPLVTPTTEG